MGTTKRLALLKARGIELEMVLDEGGVISDGILPGTAKPIALVGIAEKGFVTIELNTRVAGGHSSLPPRRNVFRFLPLRLTQPDLERMHGIDERIGIREYEAAVRTYRQLIIERAGS